MGTLYETIISLCTLKGIKGGKMCTDLGLSKSLMTKLKADPFKTITSDTAKRIADYFGVSTDYLLGLEDVRHSLYDDPSPSGDDRSFQDGVPQSVLAELNAREQEDIKKDAALAARARKEMFVELLDELSDEDLDKVIKIMLIMLNKEGK